MSDRTVNIAGTEGAIEAHVWSNDNPERIVVIAHGYGEHMGRYEHVARLLVERGAARAVIEGPTHPYAQLLVDSVPSTDPSVRWRPVRERASSISDVPQDGCPFHPRCPYVFERCPVEEPPLVEVVDGRAAACWLQPERSGEEAAPADRARLVAEVDVK